MKNLCIILVLCLPASALAQPKQRIDPAGIPGSLLLYGGDISQSAAESFVALAGGENAKLAFVYYNDPTNIKKKDRVWTEVKIISEALDKRKPGSMIKHVHLTQVKEELRDTTGVCLLVEKPALWQIVMQKYALTGAFHQLLKRGGVIATCGADLLADARGLDLLPGGLAQAGFFEEKDPKRNEKLKVPGLVGYSFEQGSALLVKGRTISAVGDKKNFIYISGKTGIREIVVEGKTQVDLTALRRAARDRLESFPPVNLAPPIVEKGTLVIVGGGGSPDGLYKRFIELAGGKGKAHIVIFPTAQPAPIPKRSFLADGFLKAGAKKATVLSGRTQAEVESKEFLDTLSEATGLWFDGGRQWRFVDCYEDTKALPLMFDVLKRGGVIGGTSAGATIQGDYLCRGGVFNNFDIRYEGYERGLGFLKGVAIDQHFTQRKRQTDMTSLMKTYPQYLGIGIDEATAIVVQGQVAEVIGRGKVHFYDARRKIEKGQPDYEAIPAGGRYDLKERKVVSP